MRKNIKDLVKCINNSGIYFAALVQYPTMDKDLKFETLYALEENLSLFGIELNIEKMQQMIGSDNKEELIHLVKTLKNFIITRLENEAGQIFVDWFQLSMNIYFAKTISPNIEPCEQIIKNLMNKLGFSNDSICDIISKFRNSQSEIAINLYIEQSMKVVEEYNYDKGNVFIVHGHDELIKEAVARFLEKLKLNAIILHEQPNKGKTIIEKLEINSNVSFAIVLLTGDDLGGIKSSDIKNMRLRARQNVIFELGYFVGKLGRDKVCVLYEENLEMPSDYDGVNYIPIDKFGFWKILLSKELKQANINIDTNLVI